jgi:GntR family transcriptional regulator
MILTIDTASETPIYQQIRDRVVEAIAAGQLPAGSQLPGVRALGTDLGINFHTVNKAYDLLRQQGLLRLGRGSGASVVRDAGSGPPPAHFTPQWTVRLRTLLAEAVAQGVNADTALRLCRQVLTTFTDPAGGPAITDVADVADIEQGELS